MEGFFGGVGLLTVITFGATVLLPILAHPASLIVTILFFMISAGMSNFSTLSVIGVGAFVAIVHISYIAIVQKYFGNPWDL